jgi:hypothetical protein
VKPIASPAGPEGVEAIKKEAQEKAEPDACAVCKKIRYVSPLPKKQERCVVERKSNQSNKNVPCEGTGEGTGFEHGYSNPDVLRIGNRPKAYLNCAWIALGVPCPVVASQGLVVDRKILPVLHAL